MEYQEAVKITDWEMLDLFFEEPVELTNAEVLVDRKNIIKTTAGRERATLFNFQRLSEKTLPSEIFCVFLSHIKWLFVFCVIRPSLRLCGDWLAKESVRQEIKKADTEHDFMLSVSFVKSFLLLSYYLLPDNPGYIIRSSRSFKKTDAFCRFPFSAELSNSKYHHLTIFILR